MTGTLDLRDFAHPTASVIRVATAPIHRRAFITSGFTTLIGVPAA